MEAMYYIGLEVHKRKNSYCVKVGTRLDAPDAPVGTVPKRNALQRRLAAIPASCYRFWIAPTELR